jgi:hypothetical protein
MELDENIIDAYWSKDNNGKQEFFIINEAIISKLCILGEDREPCFEGAQIKKFEFSFEDSFKQELSSMIFQLQEILDKEGGAKMDTEKNLSVENQEEVKVSEEEVEFKKKEEEEKDKIEKEETDKKEDKVDTDKKEDEPVTKEDTEEEDEKKKKTKFSTEEEIQSEEKVSYDLEAIPEYVELRSKYETLVSNYEKLEDTVSSLSAFKAEVEKAKKEEMINSFYMLSDEDKKDVIENINNYSLDEIESKLSVICVRNRVSFDIEETKEVEAEPVSYNLNSGELADDSIPAWVRAVRKT